MTDNATASAFSAGLDLPTEKVQRANVFTSVLADMIAAFHANGNKPVDKGAVRYTAPAVADEEPAETCRKTLNQIRDTARRMDASVSVKGRAYPAESAVVFWIVAARTHEPKPADAPADPAPAKGAK